MQENSELINLVPSIKVPDDPRIDDLIFYREGVETLMQLRSTTEISNSQPDHAAILFELFFKYARHHVRIFCRKLSSNVFSSPALIERASWALKNDVRITAMIQDENPEDNELVQLLQKSSGARLLTAPITAKDSPVNFAVMDEQAYRIEPNRDDCKAKAVMFAPQVAKQLVRKFDQLVLGVTLSRTGSAASAPLV